MSLNKKNLYLPESFIINDPQVIHGKFTGKKTFRILQGILFTLLLSLAPLLLFGFKLLGYWNMIVIGTILIIAQCIVIRLSRKQCWGCGEKFFASNEDIDWMRDSCVHCGEPIKLSSTIQWAVLPIIAKVIAIAAIFQVIPACLNGSVFEALIFLVISGGLFVPSGN
jgi:hypothetical protein